MPRSPTKKSKSPRSPTKTKTSRSPSSSKRSVTKSEKITISKSQLQQMVYNAIHHYYDKKDLDARRRSKKSISRRKSRSRSRK